MVSVQWKNKLLDTDAESVYETRQTTWSSKKSLIKANVYFDGVFIIFYWYTDTV